MSDDAVFRGAARRVLFPDPRPVQNIPGAGASAAEDADKHTRVKVTINLDADVVAHFKTKAKEEGIPYQLLLNQTLREHMLGSRPERLAREVGSVLVNDEQFLARLKQALDEGE